MTHPIKQFVKEFRADTMVRPTIDVQINGFMEDWREKHVGHLKIASMYAIDRIFPGDQKKGTWMYVVFEWWPLTQEEAENIQLLNLAKERDHGGGR